MRSAKFHVGAEKLAHIYGCKECQLRINIMLVHSCSPERAIKTAKKRIETEAKAKEELR